MWTEERTSANGRRDAVADTGGADVVVSAVMTGSKNEKIQESSLWRFTLAGLCASLVGIGLARFAYTPLIPAIVGAHWFSAAKAAYLGAANLLGYLAGAVVSNLAARRVPVRVILRWMMALATLALFACSHPAPFAWFFVWRVLSGIAGGALMVLTAPTILPHIPPSKRAISRGAIFTGIGLGIAASGTLVPLLLRGGLSQTWLGLGMLSLLLTGVAWNRWPESEPAHASPTHTVHPVDMDRRLFVLFFEYALNAVGLVPHMLFLVDFVARGLNQGINIGAEFWVLFGLGAMVGPILASHVAGRIGYGRALPLAYLLQASAISLPALGLRSGWLILSSVIVGAFTPGIVPLVFGSIQERLAHHPSTHRRNWARATVGFAISQALAAYGMSFLFARTRDYSLLFEIGSVAMVIALATNLLAGRLLRSNALSED
jgi:predicted MFS family arabinose efflux permease